MALNKRAEILFSQDELQALRREAERRGVSLGELVREAVRKVYLRPTAEQRRKAIEFFTRGPIVDVGTWEEAKKLIGRYVDKEP
jgi:ribbon-helix-helix CopG family protein